MCLSVLTLSHFAAAQTAAWPKADYAIAVGMADGSSDPKAPGIWWSDPDHGHTWLANLVERTALRNGFRRPDYLVVHCPGVCPLIGGSRRYVFNGYELAWIGTYHLGGQIAPRPGIAQDLAAWGDLANRYGMEAWIYLGQLTHPSVESRRLADPVQYQGMVRQTFQLVADAGFTGAYLDASGNPWLDGSNPFQFWPVDHPAIVTAHAEAKAAGLKLGVEAWPHQRMESLYAGAPAWMTPETFFTQHPFYSPHRWGQAPAWTHRSLVVQEHRQATPEVAQKTSQVGGIVGVSWEDWADVAAKLPPKGRPSYAPLPR